MSLLSLNQTEKIDHELQASACRIESLSEQWLTFQMNEFSPYLGMTPKLRVIGGKASAPSGNRIQDVLPDFGLRHTFELRDRNFEAMLRLSR
ncbi:hypothetical protein [Pseudomonas aeruginosa]|uniref:hypothetical protein n=1 Tax=Pseudomonas aeruginosa TaxID=287 RepID=UPI000BB58614|nr:hypothetical protein [Pseudomonas aeruginosa]PBN23626.1 hypothetical protein B8B65_28985 [Pseudomonas aeruginosa]